MIPLLTEFEKAHIGERQTLPDRYLGLSDADLADIYAYLQARPKPQAGKDIPLLNQ